MTKFIFSKDDQDIVLYNERLKDLKFTPFAKLGGGKGGKVFLYQYQGDDADILALCKPPEKNGLIAVKFSHPPDEREAAIAGRMYEFRQKNPHKPLDRVNKIQQIGDDSGFICILSQYEYFNDLEDTPSIRSDDLQWFINSNFGKPGVIPASSKIRDAFQANYDIFMSQLISNMHIAQSQFHQLGALHLDTATRNFIMNLDIDDENNVINMKPKLADFGLSSFLQPGTQFGEGYPETKNPLRWMDQNALYQNRGKTSIQTDLFALKVTIIGTLCLSFDSQNTLESQVLPKLADRGPGASQWSNAQALQFYLKHLDEIVLASACPEHQKIQLKQFLESYEYYLTQVPEGDFNSAQKEDRQLLLDANKQFILSSLKRINDSSLSNKEACLALRRLQQIDVSDQSISDHLQNRITELESGLRKEAEVVAGESSAQIAHEESHDGVSAANGYIDPQTLNPKPIAAPPPAKSQRNLLSDKPYQRTGGIQPPKPTNADKTQNPNQGHYVMFRPEKNEETSAGSAESHYVPFRQEQDGNAAAAADSAQSHYVPFRQEQDGNAASTANDASSSQEREEQSLTDKLQAIYGKIETQINTLRKSSTVFNRSSTQRKIDALINLKHHIGAKKNVQEGIDAWRGPKDKPSYDYKIISRHRNPFSAFLSFFRTRTTKTAEFIKELYDSSPASSFSQMNQQLEDNAPQSIGSENVASEYASVPAILDQARIKHSTGLLLLKAVNKEGKRVITTIGKYPFYQSTGRNSAQPETFFPFSGIYESNIANMYTRGALAKPSADILYGNNINSAYFPTALLDYILENEIDVNVISRLANIEAMTISYLIGGGYWNTDEGKTLGQFINKHFADYITDIYDEYKEAIEVCRSIQSKDDKNFKTITNFVDINQYLQERINGFEITMGCPVIAGGYKVDNKNMPQPSSTARPGL